MVGTNRILANQETMIAAFQLYLNKIMNTDSIPKVLSVKLTSTGSGYNQKDEFEIIVEEVKEDARPTE